MAKFYESITPEVRAFIEAQKVFFVASAVAGSRINLSPKGADTLRVLDERTVAWLDITGSGNETAAHLKHDGRLTLMLCSFDEEPLILRLYGRGRLVFPHEAGWDEAAAHFPKLPGARQVVVLDVESLQTSCGFGVPVAESMSERPRMIAWCEKKGERALAEYRRKNSRRSIDGFTSDTVPADDGANEADVAMAAGGAS
jgi:hypothetical protein